MSLSLYDLWLSMGLFAKSIVVVMAVMSVLSWTAAFRKWSQLYKSQKETKRFAPEFSRFLGTVMGIVNAFTGMAASPRSRR